MDKTDTRILNLIQKEFPLCPAPYRRLAEKLGLTENEVFERTKRLKKEKIIRKIGPVFDTRKMEWKTTLIAIKVIPRRLNKVAAILNAYPGITHNYVRGNEYNLWFTLACPDEGAMKKTLADIRKKTGISDMLNLPATQIFKLKTDFRIK